MYCVGSIMLIKLQIKIKMYVTNFMKIKNLIQILVCLGENKYFTLLKVFLNF